MTANDYNVIASQCRILSKDPTTPAMTASVLIAAAKAVESQAERCVALASHLEKQEAVIHDSKSKRRARVLPPLRKGHAKPNRNLWRLHRPPEVE